VLLENRVSGIVSKLLAKCELVYDICATEVVKEGGCDPAVVETLAKDGASRLTEAQRMMLTVQALAILRCSLLLPSQFPS
jgi:hypothetical protein